VFGPRSERRLPPYKIPTAKADPLETQKKRRDNAALRDGLPSEDVLHAVPPEACACDKCGGVAERLLPPKVTEEIVYVAAKFRRRRHLLQVKACHCGEFIAQAPGPARVQDKSPYHASVYAAIVAARCCDSLPFYRLAKMFKRAGVTISDRTLGDLYHRTAELLLPLHTALMALITAESVVQADETPVPLMAKDKTKRAFMWTFLAGVLIGFRFSTSRSGETPVEVLGASAGTLVVDAYSGYNAVCTPESRERAECLAHLRRKFADARKDAAVAANQALDLILDVYRVEHEAKERRIVGSPAHRELRQTKGRVAMDALHKWLTAERGKHLPKSPMGMAISYAINQWPTMLVWLGNPAVPLDNNGSERALRVIALGRKNWLFVGTDESGDNLAVLMSLVRTCEAVGVNPQAYIADVLMRIGDHPQARIVELLPQNWTPLAVAA